MGTVSIGKNMQRVLRCQRHQKPWRTFNRNEICANVTQMGYSVNMLIKNDNERQQYSCFKKCCNLQQWNHFRLPLMSSPASTSKRTFLHGQLMPLHPRRYVSTEPTTAYEIVLASKPVQLAQSLLEYSHDLTGLPWWASLTLSTIMLRAVLTFPLGVYAQYIKAKVERLQPEIVLMAKQAFVRRFAERARLEGWSEKRAERTVMRLVKQCAKELFIRDNCHPAKGSILLFVQLPLWVCLSLALRNMTGAFAGTVYLNPDNIVPALSTEGTLWFPDLTMVDPFIILPVLVGLLNLCNIEMMALHKNPVSKTQRYVTNLLRCLSLAMIPIAAYVPTAMTLYWATSAFYGLSQNILLKSPTARLILNVPTAPSDSKTPFKDMKDIIKTRYLGGTNSDEGNIGKNAQDVDEERMKDRRKQEIKRKERKEKSRWKRE